MIDEFEKIDMEALVPHKGSMCLLDRVLQVGEDWIVTEVLIREDNIFAGEHGVPAWVGIEFMAQTISALAGVRELKGGNPIKLGFLLGTRKYLVNQSHFSLGSKLQIQANEMVLGDNGLGAFDCTIESEDCFAQAKINVFQPSNPQEFLTRE